MAGYIFTTQYDRISNVLQNKVHIASQGEKRFSNLQFVATWDTGATATVVSKNVVEKLNLKPVSKQKVYTASGPNEVYSYYITVKLPNNVTVNNVRATEGDLFGCDVLIGMDIIGQGDLVITNHNQTVFSFRMPSMQRMDFLKDSYLKPVKVPKKIGRNDPCPCGSGKKYKYCCIDK